MLDRFAVLALQLRELHDEDRVLRREPDQHDQGDLRVDVVVEMPQQKPEEGAEDAERNHQ